MTCRLWIFLGRQRADCSGHSCARVRDGSEPHRDSAQRPPIFSRPGIRLDREPMRPEDSFLERLSERDRRDSEIAPVLWMATFGSCINFREKRFVKPQQDCPRLHLYCLGELPERVPFVLGSLRPPGVVAHATVPRRDRTISSRSVSSHASPYSSRVACFLHRHEPNRYRLMDD